jgi:hypothetical protein
LPRRELFLPTHILTADITADLVRLVKFTDERDSIEDNPGGFQGLSFEGCRVPVPGPAGLDDVVSGYCYRCGPGTAGVGFPERRLLSDVGYPDKGEDSVAEGRLGPIDPQLQQEALIGC